MSGINSARAIAVSALVLGALTASAAERHALLIGINAYERADIPDLRGAVNDVELARELLISRLGFRDEDIVMLKDAEATRAAIVAALDDLAGKAAADDVVYIHYSGHGSTVRDENGDESLEHPGDTKDETLMPHDARLPGIADITDDELNAVLARLDSSEVVVVLDSCYSGTATRGAVSTRGFEEDLRVELYERAGVRATEQVAELTHLLLTGAADDQLALDGRVPNGSFQGFFSYALGEVLDEHGPGVTPLQIDQGVKELLLQMGRELTGIQVPEPQVEGPDMLRPLFTDAEPLASRRFAVAEPLRGGEVRLLDAVRLGAAPGTYWGIYEPGETRFVSGEQRANVAIEYTRGGDAYGRVDPAAVRIAGNSRAVRVSATPPARELSVAIRTGDSSLRSALTAEITRQLDGVRFVGDDELSPFIVELPDPDTTGGVQQVVLLDMAGLQEKDRFTWAGAERSAERLVTAFLRGSNVHSITSLKNPASNMRLDVGIVNESAERGIAVVPQYRPGRYRIRQANEVRGPANSLMLELECDRDCYITLVDIDSEGKVTVLFPNEYQNRDFLPQGLLRGGQTVRVPDALDDGNAAGFHWDYTEPAGVDTVHVFATEYLETAEKIRRSLRLADSGGRSRSAFHDNIESLRGELVERGIAVVPAAQARPADVGDWTTASVTINVVAR